MDFYKQFLASKPIVLRWEGDDELWLLKDRKLICMATNGQLDGGGIDGDIPVIEIDRETEREISGSNECPTHEDVFDFIIRNPDRVPVDLDFDLVSYLKGL